ncbi:MAG: hypothetical protein ACRDJC_26425 [Thermomicrobiales bacterium]
MSTAEVKRLLWGIVLRWWPPRLFVLAWSRWRRIHQACAKRCHYRHRGAICHDLQL